jgi:hypothetical protein
LDDEAGLFGTCPPAPGAPVLPWLPDIGFPPDGGLALDIGRGTIVFVTGNDGPCEPPIVLRPGCAPRATAVARQTYAPLPLPYMGEPLR